MEQDKAKETAPPSGAGAATVGPARPSGETEEAKPSDVLSPDAPDGLRKAADGDAGKVTVGEERGALEWLLGATTPVEYDVPVKFDTPAGTKELIFHIRQLDGKTIIKTEEGHRKGSGPFAELDDIPFNADLAAQATIYIKDESGRKVEPSSAEFDGGLGFGPALAMETRFKYQPGLLEGIATRIRTVSGYSPDRVGEAERATEAALGG